MTKPSIPTGVRVTLLLASGGVCAICKSPLTETKEGIATTHVSNIAHIRGEAPGSARYDPAMTDEERSAPSNLLVADPRCHTRIDNDAATFTVQRLTAIKSEHEQQVRSKQREIIPTIGFPEFDVVIEFLRRAPISSETGSDLVLVPPAEKIARNGLSEAVKGQITLGMAQTWQVKDYLNRQPDAGFSDRLRRKFVEEYRRLREAQAGPDALFGSLLSFCTHDSPELRTQLAGLSVLTYFFELCEVFEK